MNRATLARLLLIVAIAFGILFYTVGGLVKPEYSHFSNFISELNATGTPWAKTLTFAGFLPLSLLLAAFLITAAPLVHVQGLSRVGYLLLWSQPLAFIGVILAPCDAGCPVNGSSSQDLHNLLGLITYFGAGLAFVLLSFAPGFTGRARIWRHVLWAAGMVWVVLFVLMLEPDLAAWRGMVQRIADIMLAAVLVLVAWGLIPGARYA